MHATLLFGHPELHQRIAVLTDILAALLQRAPNALQQGDLPRLTGHAPRELARHCGLLWQAQLIAPAPDGAWRLSPIAHAMTLEDVYRCALTGIATEAAAVVRESQLVAVERLLGQAALALELAIGKELRAFPLARLRSGAPGPGSLPLPFRCRDAGEPGEPGYHAAFKSDQELHP